MTEGWISVVKVAGKEWIKMNRYDEVPTISIKAKDLTGGDGGSGNYEEKDDAPISNE